MNDILTRKNLLRIIYVMYSYKKIYILIPLISVLSFWFIDPLFPVSGLLVFSNKFLSIFSKLYAPFTLLFMSFIIFCLLYIFYRKKQIHAHLFNLFLLINANMFVLGLLKLSIPRTRPCYLDILQKPLVPDALRSFPSSHAAVVFAIAFFLHKMQPKYKYYYYSTACILSILRVLVQEHFPSDVLVGAWLGLVITPIFLKMQSLIFAEKK